VFHDVIKMDLKGSRTEKNLLAAFAGESQARNRYTYFASEARKSGYEQISAIFLETAENEKEHAKVFFSFLKGGDVEIVAKYPAGEIGTLAENLKAAAAGEKLEWGALYPEFKRIAEEEGFNDIAEAFKRIGEVESYHERRYLKLLQSLERNEVFEKPVPVKWKCRNCGYVFEGKSAPNVCPACKHPRAFYELWVENY